MTVVTISSSMDMTCFFGSSCNSDKVSASWRSVTVSTLTGVADVAVDVELVAMSVSLSW